MKRKPPVFTQGSIREEELPIYWFAKRVRTAPPTLWALPACPPPQRMCAAQNMSCHYLVLAAGTAPSPRLL